MADPYLDEAMVLQTLNVPCAIGSVERLQQGALFAIVDGFDRRILRDPFITVTAAACSMHTFLGSLHVLSRAKELVKQEKLTLDRLQEAEISLAAYAETQRLALVKEMELVAQCPTSQDKVS